MQLEILDILLIIFAIGVLGFCLGLLFMTWKIRGLYTDIMKDEEDIEKYT